ncbi:ABC transporter permease [Bacillus sp. JCM 19034]|uniref:ABC transporter permease n=1 Tax=Bacillus sp. JCM 19034 TaxID=1481928 RepID=UPI000781F50D|nr:ABC transporter permease [Bacillus sp. JCM 19034]
MKNYINELLKRKDLLIYLVKSGLKAEHRNSYLGYFWWLLDPLLNVAVYFFLVAIVLGRAGDDPREYLVYLAIGLISWRWISTTVNSSAKSITKYSSIINQVYLPKSIFPFAFTFSQLFNFGFGLIVIAIFLIFSGTIPGWQVVYLPFIIVAQLLFLIAIGLMLAYFNVFIRDIDYVLTHVTRVMFYASPIIWMGRLSGTSFSWIVDYNPVAILVNSYRDVLMYHSTPDLVALMIIAVVSLMVSFGMLYHYSRNEHKIIKAL